MNALAASPWLLLSRWRTIRPDATGAWLVVNEHGRACVEPHTFASDEGKRAQQRADDLNAVEATALASRLAAVS